MANAKLKATNSEVLPLEARCIRHILDFSAPQTTQDSVDQLAAEYATANLLRSASAKRYETVKKHLEEEHHVVVDKVRKAATKLMEKSSASIKGEDWLISLAANKPSTSVNENELRTELVRQGVDVDLIDAAIAKVRKKNNPALIITTTLMRE